MPDYTIKSDEIGAYEIPLTAGNITRVSVDNPDGFVVSRVQISVHDASMPIYARAGDTVSVKDPVSSVVTAGTWMDMQGTINGKSSSIALISAADATVSVSRS
jgi:hypothetical protein